MNKIFKGAFVLGVSALFVKALGALYRVFLTNLIGGEGVGIYQMIFPFYTILLTLSSTGIPNAVSKLIAEGNNPEKVLYRSIIAFSLLGFAGFFLMFFGAGPLSLLQGNYLAAKPYQALAPSVFLVSLIAPIRGYFQGKLNMLPTAVSQVMEQVVKLCLGLLLIYTFSSAPSQGAFFAALSVTVSEVVALIYLGICLAYKNGKNSNWLKNLRIESLIDGVIEENISKNDQPDFKERISLLDLPSAVKRRDEVSLKQLLKIVLPITLSSIMLPLSRAVDSFLAINLLQRGGFDGTSLFGLYAGSVETIVGVPVAICYGVSTCAIPALAKKNSEKTTDKTEKREKIDKVIGYSLALSLIFGLGIFLFGGIGVEILFSSLKEEQLEISKRLLRISSVSVVLLPVLQTTVAVLIAKSKPYFSCLSLFCGLLVKIAVTLITLPNGKIGVYGMAFSDITCYFVATFFNLLYIITEEKQGETSKTKKGVKPMVLK